MDAAAPPLPRFDNTLPGDRLNGKNHLKHVQNSMMTAEPFNFLTWVRLHGIDILTMAGMGAIALGVHFAPGPHRVFFLYNLDGSIIDPSIALPRRTQIIPTWASAIIAIFVPLLFFALAQIRRRSIDDLLTTFLGLLRSIITGTVFQVIIKALIGGLRPHFYDACKPNVPNTGEQTGEGFGNLMYDVSVCTGNPEHIKDALKTMPSGHTTNAWAGLFFLALYFNAQLKVISGHNPAYWKMIVLFAPLLLATAMTLALLKDHHHHPSDVVVGMCIGISTALVAFRQTFAAVFDYRFNHVLLPRATSLFHPRPYSPIPDRGPYYSYQPATNFVPRDLPVTREGGWGYGDGEQTSGAPGDATALVAGPAQSQPTGITVRS